MVAARSLLQAHHSSESSLCACSRFSGLGERLVARFAAILAPWLARGSRVAPSERHMCRTHVSSSSISHIINSSTVGVCLLGRNPGAAEAAVGDAKLAIDRLSGYRPASLNPSQDALQVCRPMLRRDGHPASRETVLAVRSELKAPHDTRPARNSSCLQAL